ncbi:MAG: hypothetical protein U0599_17810 [Vicinamibacteria bacterium]
MNLPDELLRLGATRLLGVPAPVLVLGMTLGLATSCWARPPSAGKPTPSAATRGPRAAQPPVDRRLAAAYLASGAAAAIGATLALAQLGAVSPTFDRDREFSAIAAAVLGGTSLFGGRGQVLPGALLGALLIQTVENGLVVLNADPYLYPLVAARSSSLPSSRTACALAGRCGRKSPVDPGAGGLTRGLLQEQLTTASSATGFSSCGVPAVGNHDLARARDRGDEPVRMGGRDPPVVSAPGRRASARRRGGGVLDERRAVAKRPRASGSRRRRCPPSCARPQGTPPPPVRG